FGRAREEMLALDAFGTFVAAEERETLRARAQARDHGEPVPTDFEIQGLHKDGSVFPMRVRTAPCPVAGPRATLYLVEDARERGVSAQLIRGLVDVSVALQRERSEE